MGLRRHDQLENMSHYRQYASFGCMHGDAAVSRATSAVFAAAVAAMALQTPGST